MAIAELQGRPMDHVQKIATWKKYGLDEAQIVPCYHAVGIRAQPITTTEGQLLGIELSLKLAALREKINQGTLEYLQQCAQEDAGEIPLSPTSLARTKDLICRALLGEFTRE